MLCFHDARYRPSPQHRVRSLWTDTRTTRRPCCIAACAPPSSSLWRRSVQEGCPKRVVFVLKETQPEAWVSNGGDFTAYLRPPGVQEVVDQVRPLRRLHPLIAVMSRSHRDLIPAAILPATCRAAVCAPMSTVDHSPLTSLGLVT